MVTEMMHIHASATHWDFWIRNTKLCWQEQTCHGVKIILLPAANKRCTASIKVFFM